MVWANYAGERVPTFQDAIDLVRGKAGLFPELKSPDVYRDRGMDMEPLVVAALRKNRLDRKGADSQTPIILQSFDQAALQALTRDLPTLDRTFLLTAWHDPLDVRHRTQRGRDLRDGPGPVKDLA